MVMFTETKVLRLRTLSKVSRPSLVDWSIYNALQCELELEDIKAHYNSYLAAGHISVYNCKGCIEEPYLYHAKELNLPNQCYWGGWKLRMDVRLRKPTSGCCSFHQAEYKSNITRVNNILIVRVSNIRV